MLWRRLPALGALVLVCGCGLGAPGSTAAPTASPGTQASAPGSRASPGAAADWPTYHGDLARTGAAHAGPASFAAADPAWQSERLDGEVYAEPIVVSGTAYVATENDTVYAFDARSGSRVWQQHLGEPVDGNGLPCGNIKPVTGITGTPAADPVAGLLYVVAYLKPGQHELFALSLKDGSTSFHRTVDPPGAPVNVLQERAALAVSNGKVYVAYGGLLGDCGPYHGWVVAAPAGSASGSLGVYQVPSTRAAGIWATSGVSVDAFGNVFVATGNSYTSGAFDYNDAVIKLSAELSVEDYWAPANWLALSRADTDIGSVGPALLDGGLIFQSGKNGAGYLIRADRLGQVGGQAATVQVCQGGVFGGTAYSGGVVYVPCTDGLAAVRIDAASPSMAVAWRGPRFNAGPPIVAGGAVWVCDPGAGALVALDPATGTQRLRKQLGTMMHFTTPSAWQDEILVAAGGQLLALRLS